MNINSLPQYEIGKTYRYVEEDGPTKLIRYGDLLVVVETQPWKQRVTGDFVCYDLATKVLTSKGEVVWLMMSGMTLWAEHDRRDVVVPMLSMEPL